MGRCCFVTNCQYVTADPSLAEEFGGDDGGKIGAAVRSVDVPLSGVFDGNHSSFSHHDRRIVGVVLGQKIPKQQPRIRRPS